MKKFLLYSTIFGIFTEAARVHVAIDLKLMYLIVLINTLILLSINKKIYVPRYFGIMFCYLLFSAFWGYFKGTDDFSHASQQILGILISVLFFYNLFRSLNLNTVVIFNVYIKAAIILSYIGLIIFSYQILSGHWDYRLSSLMTEPAHFAGIVAPAFYYLLKNFKANKTQFFAVTFALLCSGSAVGFICLLLSIILYNKNIFLPRNLIIYSVVVGLGFTAYYMIDNVRMRVDDTLQSSNFDVTGANWSTYALVSNAFVTTEVLKRDPIFGNGIGSHELSHHRYIKDLEGNEGFEWMHDLNANDANSLLLRILSDFGLLGALLVIYLVTKYYSSDNNYYIMSRAIIIYFFYKLFREGHYFPPEMYFFVWLYYFHYRERIRQLKGVTLRKSALLFSAQQQI